MVLLLVALSRCLFFLSLLYVSSLLDISSAHFYCSVQFLSHFCIASHLVGSLANISFLDSEGASSPCETSSASFCCRCHATKTKILTGCDTPHFFSLFPPEDHDTSGPSLDPEETRILWTAAPQAGPFRIRQSHSRQGSLLRSI
jgi:hypothetical protein